MFKAFLRLFSTYGLLILGISNLSASAHAQTLAKTIQGVGFGDSLMVGYQLTNGEGFTDQLQQALIAKGYDVTITNAGVSGDTSSGGLARLDWSVPDTTDFVILELGANDALRGISPDITRQNLDQMIIGLKARSIDVVLVGILAPPNMGVNYENQFNPIYAELAQKHNIPLYPFFLEGVITEPTKLLSDGMHPNPEGVKTMVEGFLPTILAYLEKRS
ncbi:MAG: arylesterase [Ahrensia sp.]|nr:arylesterase [Ahrensia sp.]